MLLRELLTHKEFLQVEETRIWRPRIGFAQLYGPAKELHFPHAGHQKDWSVGLSAEHLDLPISHCFPMRQAMLDQHNSAYIVITIMDFWGDYHRLILNPTQSIVLGDINIPEASSIVPPGLLFSELRPTPDGAFNYYRFFWYKYKDKRIVISGSTADILTSCYPASVEGSFINFNINSNNYTEIDTVNPEDGSRFTMKGRAPINVNNLYSHRDITIPGLYPCDPPSQEEWAAYEIRMKAEED